MDLAGHLRHRREQVLHLAARHFEAGRSLLDQVAFEQNLEELLGCPVDVVVEGGISPHLEGRILAEARPS
jgi:predicted nucleotidyltransferase